MNFQRISSELPADSQLSSKVESPLEIRWKFVGSSSKRFQGIFSGLLFIIFEWPVIDRCLCLNNRPMIQTEFTLWRAVPLTTAKHHCKRGYGLIGHVSVDVSEALGLRDGKLFLTWIQRGYLGGQIVAGGAMTQTSGIRMTLNSTLNCQQQ